MSEKSLLDYGFDVLSASKEPVKFIELFNKALELSGLELAKAAQIVMKNALGVLGVSAPTKM